MIPPRVPKLFPPFHSVPLSSRQGSRPPAMDLWFIFLVTLSIALLLKAIFDHLFPKRASKPKLPPGPHPVPIIGSFLWLRKSFAELEPILRSLRARYGPVVTLHVGSRPAIFVSAHSLAHEALVQKGAVFADRPPAPVTSRILSSNQHNVSSASYGPTWRLLRRNLTAEILHPSRVKSYSRARAWVLDILVKRLESRPDGLVCVVDDFQYAIFCLLVLMCFGDRLGEEQIRRVEDIQRRLLLGMRRFNLLNFWPKLGRVLFFRRWKEFDALRQEQMAVLVPLIRARANRERTNGAVSEDIGEDKVVSYVDSLLELRLPEAEGKRKLTEEEMVSLCSEFLNGGTDTTSTALQWIMANLVNHPDIQQRLYEEMEAAVGHDARVLAEEELHKVGYLKAVVLEGLRRHPPGHFVLPHAVTEDVELGGYTVPKDGSINFLVAEMSWDSSVWEDPMEFKPDRFLKEKEKGKAEVMDFDVTGSREVKMMPFGAGRRICPAWSMAILHLEYFVGNLVWWFEWRPEREGEQVDLTEKLEFTMVMKTPLRARIAPRSRRGLTTA